MSKHRKHIRRWPKLAAFALVVAGVFGAALVPSASAVAITPSPVCTATECTWHFAENPEGYDWVTPPGTAEVWIETQSANQPWSAPNRMRARLVNVPNSLFVSFMFDWAGVGLGSWTFFLTSADPTMQYSFDPSMVSDVTYPVPESAPGAFVRITQVIDPNYVAPAVVVSPTPTATPTPISTPDPTATPTPDPTATPTPDPTPMPTVTPTPEPTVTPTPTQSPTATSEATVMAAPAPPAPPSPPVSTAPVVEVVAPAAEAEPSAWATPMAEIVAATDEPLAPAEPAAASMVASMPKSAEPAAESEALLVDQPAPVEAQPAEEQVLVGSPSIATTDDQAARLWIVGLSSSGATALATIGIWQGRNWLRRQTPSTTKRGAFRAKTRLRTS